MFQHTQGRQFKGFTGRAVHVAAVVGIAGALVFVHPGKAASVGYGTYKYKAGFDSCTSVFQNNPSDLETWWLYSPYWVYSFDLKGASYQTYRQCTSLSATNVAMAASEGWGIIPIWYGPQMPSPCWTPPYASLINLNTSTAYTQGVQEADKAATAASSLGLAADGVIMYDLEGEGKGTSSCVNAARAFVDGWDYEMNVNTLYWAGLYGGTQTVNFRDFAPPNIANVPFNIMPWYPGDVTGVYQLADLPDDLWSQDQRFHQLRKDEDEQNYGGAPAYINEDCSDSRVFTNNTVAINDSVNNCNSYDHPNP